jgi:branched-chain amino acid transport system permease protein
VILTDLLQFVLGGLVIGSIYAIAAIAYTGIYNITGVINFAQGDMAMIAAMVAIHLCDAGIPYPLAVALAILFGGALGALIERTAIRPLRNHVLRAIIVTIGIGVALSGITVVLWGTEARTLPSPVPAQTLHILGATLPSHSLLVLVVSALLVCGLALLFQGTYIGRAFRACAVNPFAAQLAGIEVSTMSSLAFVLSGILGAIAGIMVAPITLMQYDTGIAIGLKGFVACMIGGLGNPVGAFAGGLFLGIVESLASGVLSSGWKNAIAFLLLIAILLLRPGGLFGEMERSAR